MALEVNNKLVDEILEKLTEDAIQHTPSQKPCFIQREHVTSWGDAEIEEITDYKETISIISRTVGNSLFMPNYEPLVDAHCLARKYALIELQDPYDGLDEFLEEQKADDT